MTNRGFASRLGRDLFVSRLVLSSAALVMATGCLFGDMKPKKAGGNAGQAGIAGWQNGTTMGNGQESAIGGTRGSSNDTRDHGGATSTGGTTSTTVNIGGANQGGAATGKDVTEVVGGVGTSSGTSSSGIGGAVTVLSGGMQGDGTNVAIAGNPSTGGAPPTGGVSPSGGAANTGGKGPAAGAPSTGGTRATGGSPASGGTTSMGGSTIAQLRRSLRQTNTVRLQLT